MGEEDQRLKACTVFSCLSPALQAFPPPVEASPVCLFFLTNLTRLTLRHASHGLSSSPQSLLARLHLISWAHGRSPCHVRRWYRVISIYRVSLTSHPPTHARIHCSILHTETLQSHSDSHSHAMSTQWLLCFRHALLLCLLTALSRPTRDPFLLSLSCQRRTKAA